MNVVQGLLFVADISGLCELVNINLVCSRIHLGSDCFKSMGVSLAAANP